MPVTTLPYMAKRTLQIGLYYGFGDEEILLYYPAGDDYPNIITGMSIRKKEEARESASEQEM